MDYLIAHACFACRKSWKMDSDRAVACPECAGPAHWMGRSFRTPRRTDSDQWKKVELLWNAGFRFHGDRRHPDAERFPDTPGEVAAFIARNPDHPLRLGTAEAG